MSMWCPESTRCRQRVPEVFQAVLGRMAGLPQHGDAAEIDVLKEMALG